MQERGRWSVSATIFRTILARKPLTRWRVPQEIARRERTHSAGIFTPGPMDAQCCTTHFSTAIVLAFRRFDITGSFVQRTCEYKGQPKCDRFGSITLNFTF